MGKNKMKTKVFFVAAKKNWWGTSPPIYATLPVSHEDTASTIPTPFPLAAIAISVFPTACHSRHCDCANTNPWEYETGGMPFYGIGHAWSRYSSTGINTRVRGHVTHGYVDVVRRQQSFRRVRGPSKCSQNFVSFWLNFTQFNYKIKCEK